MLKKESATEVAPSSSRTAAALLPAAALPPATCDGHLGFSTLGSGELDFLRRHDLPPIVMPPSWRHGDTVGISFSGGKESLAIAAALRACGVSFVSVFFDLLPGSDLTREIPSQWPDLMGDVTVRTHPRFIDALNKGLWESRKSMRSVRRLRLAGYTFQQAAEDAHPDVDWWAIGIRGADSPMRAMAVKKTKGVVGIKRQFWPLAHWRIADVRKMLSLFSIELPKDYKLFGRSFDGFESRYTSRMSPHDRSLMDELFPHWRAECARRIYAQQNHG